MLKLITVGMLLMCSVAFSDEPLPAVKTSKLDYTPCLKSLNEKSLVLKDRIVPLDNEGWTFAVKGENGSMTILGEGGTYTLSTAPASCTARREVNALQYIKSLYEKAVGRGSDPKNSDENKKIIVAQCKALSDVWFRSEPGPTGFLMPGGRR